MTQMSELDFYKLLPDYEDIKQYLELDPEDYEPPLELPVFQPNYDSSIIVDGTPITTVDKVPKLLSVLLKIFKQFSSTITESDFELPINEATGSTYGFCFIRFSSKDEAEKAVSAVQGFEMGKNKFKLSLYSDFDKYGKITEEFIPKDLPEFRQRPDPRSWLCDSLGRDQFALRYAKETQIMWANTSVEDPNNVYNGEREKSGGKSWCENRIAWSPQGSYLATFHPPGIKLWGSSSTEEFLPQGRYLHREVEDIEFSPCENYIITYRFSPSANESDPNNAICIWNVITGENVRSFGLKNPLEPKYQVKGNGLVIETKAVKKPDTKEGKDLKEKDNKLIERPVRGRVVSYDENRNGSFIIEEGNERYIIAANKIEPLQEPNRLKGSPDGNYVARVGADMIQVYSLPDVQLLEKKSIPAKDVIDFSWSPKHNIISYWSPAVSNHPATVNLIRIPSKTDLSSRKFFDVVDIKMIWQSNGDYLCAKMQNKKKINILVFFRLNESGIPVEQLEFTENIQSVTWEPAGERFVIVLGERNPTISFYSMAGTTTVAATSATTSAKSTTALKVVKEVTPLFNVTGIQCNETLWSPAGGIIALAHFTGDSCSFQLHDVENNLKLANKVHPRCNRLYWDPSGRLLASVTLTELRNAAVRGHPEDGYNIYTFQGNSIANIKRDKLFFFLWRPRPKDILTAEAKKAVVKNLKKYERMFEREDRLRLEELNKEVLFQRRQLATDFIAVLRKNRETNLTLKSRRIEARNGYDSDDENNYHIQVQVILFNFIKILNQLY